MEHFFPLLMIALIQGFIGWLIAKRKGRGTAGFWWSFFLGFIGWLIAACMEPTQLVRLQRFHRDMEAFKASQSIARHY